MKWEPLPSPGGAALDDVSAVKTLETMVAYTTRVIASGTKAAGRNAVAIADVVRALGPEELSMSPENYDVLILGGGNAGMGVTVATRAAGLSVAMVESRDLGGTCPNRGCTPKKVLVAAGHALHEIERARVHGISVGEPRLDWAALIDREKHMISHIPSSLGQLMADRGVEVIRGEAALRRPQCRARRQPHDRGPSHRHCHGFEVTHAADPWRRADDHIR